MVPVKRRKAGIYVRISQDRAGLEEGIARQEEDCRELAKRLTAVAPHIEVIYMSGYADDVLAYHGTLKPGTILIQKPFRPAALFSKLREVLDGRKRRPPVPVDPLYHRAVNS